MNLDIKIKSAIHLIKSLDGLMPELCYSGGKDSDVILALAQMSGIEFNPIYRMTTIDPPGTLTHVITKGVCVRKPSLTFFQLIQRHGFPTRRCRFCCSNLKEYKILDKSILGIRRCESVRRAKLYREPSMCRIYSNNSRVEQFYPILDWTNNDVKEFVDYYHVKCHPLYYVNGVFDPSKRLGCMCCPLASDNGRADFIKYPRMVKAWIDNGKLWLQSHPNVKCNHIYGSIYNLFFSNVFCKSHQDYLYKTNGLFGNLDCKQWLEDYFKIDL